MISSYLLATIDPYPVHVYAATGSHIAYFRNIFFKYIHSTLDCCLLLSVVPSGILPGYIWVLWRWMVRALPPGGQPQARLSSSDQSNTEAEVEVPSLRPVVPSQGQSTHQDQTLLEWQHLDQPDLQTKSP